MFFFTHLSWVTKVRNKVLTFDKQVTRLEQNLPPKLRRDVSGMAWERYGEPIYHNRRPDSDEVKRSVDIAMEWIVLFVLEANLAIGRGELPIDKRMLAARTDARHFRFYTEKTSLQTEINRLRP
jgi:hypothetical protein